MTDPFILTIKYKGKQLELPAQLLLQGYIHKFAVNIGEVKLYFEPDEEGGYRAVGALGQDLRELEKLDRGLLEAIQQQILAIRE